MDTFSILKISVEMNKNEITRCIICCAL